MAAEELEAQMGLGITFSVGVGQATIRTVWVDAGDVPDTMSKCQSFVDLVQILWESGMHQGVWGRQRLSNSRKECR